MATGFIDAHKVTGVEIFDGQVGSIHEIKMADTQKQLLIDALKLIRGAEKKIKQALNK